MKKILILGTKTHTGRMVSVYSYIETNGDVHTHSDSQTHIHFPIRTTAVHLKKYLNVLRVLLGINFVVKHLLCYCKHTCPLVSN